MIDVQGAGDGAVIEWAPFRLVAHATEAQLLEASDALQREFLVRQPGFVRRELLKGADGQWADFVVWRDGAAATAAMQAVAASPVCLTYFQLMEGGDDMSAETGVQHLRRVRTYPA